MRDQSITIQCTRTMSELRTFIWKNGRAEAQSGYNDDMVMSLATACYVRDTALQFAQQGIDLTKAMLTNTTKNSYSPIRTATRPDDYMRWDTGKGTEDLGWLLG